MAEEQSKTPATDKANGKPPSFPDPMSKMAYEQIVGLTTERNSLVGQINAVKGDPAQLRDHYKENPPTAELKKLRDEWQSLLDKAFEVERKLEAGVAPKVEEDRANAEAKVADTEKKVEDLDTQIRAATTYFKKLYEPLVEFLPKLERKSGGSRAGSATGSKRIRGYTWDVTVDGDTTGYDNLSGVAKELGVETATLQTDFFKAAGTEVLADAPVQVIWTAEVKKDDKTKQVKIRGTRVAKEETSSEETAA